MSDKLFQSSKKIVCQRVRLTHVDNHKPSRPGETVSERLPFRDSPDAGYPLCRRDSAADDPDQHQLALRFEKNESSSDQNVLARIMAPDRQERVIV